MYTKIVAQVYDQTLRVTNIPKLASGGENEVRVEATFDSLWTGFGKTAIFYRNEKKNQVYHVVMKSDTCVIPREVMAEPGVVYFGILGTSGSTVRTTEVVTLTVEQGAVTGLGPFTPLPDVYKQVLSAYAKTTDDIAVERARLDNLVAGGTSDDAELLDMRVGYDGTTYASAGEAVRDQTRDISRKIKTVRGKNVYNPDNDIAGYLTETGEVVEYSDWVTTGFIDVGGFSAIALSVDYDSGGTRGESHLHFLCVYDSAKQFIKQVYVSGEPTYTVEAGVKYVRFCYHASEGARIQVENGAAFTDYEAYWERHGFDLALHPYTEKKWVCMGDSLTEANARTDKNYHDYIAEETGITVVNMGRSGSGYKRTEDEGYAFYQRISDVPVDADVVTIFGSGNDLTFSDTLGAATDTGTDTICGCINTTIDNLYAVMPLARLGIISPTPWVNNQPSDNGTMCAYSDALKMICELRGIPFLDLFHCSGLRPNDATFRGLAYSKDDGNGVHPDEAGHALIAPRIKAFLETLL